MENEIKQIFARQFKRLESILKEVNCPQIYLDSISKYWGFCEKDIMETVRRQEDEISEDNQNYNR